VLLATYEIDTVNSLFFTVTD